MATRKTAESEPKPLTATYRGHYDFREVIHEDGNQLFAKGLPTVVDDHLTNLVEDENGGYFADFELEHTKKAAAEADKLQLQLELGEGVPEPVADSTLTD